MRETKRAPGGGERGHGKAPRVLLGAILLISFSLIAYEIALSRLLSVLLSYHYVFAVLSLALLGLGLGGLLLHVASPQATEPDRAFRLLILLATGFSASVPISVVAVVGIGHAEFLTEDALWYVPVLLAPFLLAGALLAELYRSFPGMSSRTYGADLVGAAAGSLGVILLLDMLGGIRVHFALGAIAAVGALLLAAAGTRSNAVRQWKIPLLGALFSCALLANSVTGLLPLDVPVGKAPTKEIHDALSSFGGKVIETRWSAFGRTDMVAFGHYPDHMDIYLDGTAGSPMYRFSGHARDPGPAIQSLKDSFPGYFPFLHLKEEERDSALIIGPGGGRDILLALMGGVKRIVAVEINGDLVDMVRRYSEFNGGIYTAVPNVEVVVDEGRNFLKRQKDRYDVILLSLPVTNTSRSLEGYALTESFLFTTDSMLDYLEHLTDEGCLIVVAHNDAEILRLLSLSLRALSGKGVGNASAMSRIYVVGSDEYLVFVLKKKEFQPSDILKAYGSMVQMGYERASSYFPHVGQMGGLNPALTALGSGQIGLDQLVKMVEDRGYDVTPVSDDRPFFYKIERGTPKAVSVVFWSSVLLFLLVAGAVPFRARGTSPRARCPGTQRSGRFDRSLWKFMALFSLLGIGFMMVEISLIQRFSLFVGQPVMCLGVMLCSLLGAGGLGSLWSGRFPVDATLRPIAFASICTAVTVLSYVLLLPAAFAHLMGLSLTGRLVATAMMVTPLGVLMGIPFSLGVRALGRKSQEGIIPWMWGLNGVGSVVGSALTIFVAMNFGFAGSLLVGALCYLAIFLVFLKR